MEHVPEESCETLGVNDENIDIINQGMVDVKPFEKISRNNNFVNVKLKSQATVRYH